MRKDCNCLRLERYMNLSEVSSSSLQYKLARISSPTHNQKIKISTPVNPPLNQKATPTFLTFSLLFSAKKKYQPASPANPPTKTKTPFPNHHPQFPFP